jgi:hypothetical protein
MLCALNRSSPPRGVAHDARGLFCDLSGFASDVGFLEIESRRPPLDGTH